MLIDHLVMFTDEPTAFAALPQHTVVDEDTQITSWNPGYAMPVTVSVPDGNNDGGMVQLPEYFVWISLPFIAALIQNLPNNACRIIADRDAFEAGDPNFIKYQAPDLTQEVLNTAQISPVFAGTHYPFGGQQ